MNKFDKIQICITKALAAVFAISAAFTVYGVVFERAWWHIGTFAIELTMASVLWRDARKDELDSRSRLCGNDGGNDVVDDPDPYPEE